MQIQDTIQYLKNIDLSRYPPTEIIQLMRSVGNIGFIEKIIKSMV